MKPLFTTTVDKLVDRLGIAVMVLAVLYLGGHVAHAVIVR